MAAEPYHPIVDPFTGEPIVEGETVEGEPPRPEITVRVPQTDMAVMAGRHPTANTVEALRSAIDNSQRILAQVAKDLAAIVGEGLRPPVSLSAHRSFHLMRMRRYVDLYYTALNDGIEIAMGKLIGDITIEDIA